VTVALDLLGHPVEVDCESAEVERAVRTVLTDLLATAEGGSQPERVTVHGPLSARLRTGLFDSLNQAALRFGTGRLMPRAAAVARSDGSTVLLCGGPGAGTSTLTAALVTLGCAYLTDETALLDPDSLEVQPFRQPIRLRPGSPARRADVQPSWAGPDDVWLVPSGGFASVSIPEEPLEPRLLVLPEYDAGARGVEVAAVPPGEAAYLVGLRSSRLGEVTGGPLPVLGRLARRVPAFRVRHDDHLLAAEEVLRLWPTG
jgi:hypothetical protein